jgi:hypothetical protein
MLARAVLAEARISGAGISYFLLTDLAERI